MGECLVTQVLMVLHRGREPFSCHLDIYNVLLEPDRIVHLKTSLYVSNISLTLPDAPAGPGPVILLTCDAGGPGAPHSCFRSVGESLLCWRRGFCHLQTKATLAPGVEGQCLGCDPSTGKRRRKGPPSVTVSWRCFQGRHPDVTLICSLVLFLR